MCVEGWIGFPMGGGDMIFYIFEGSSEFVCGPEGPELPYCHFRP